MAPTPPPDIDLEKWSASLDLVESREPQRLRLTHFGAVDDVDEHITQMRGRLAAWGEVAKAADLERFVEVIEEETRASTGDGRPPARTSRPRRPTSSTTGSSATGPRRRSGRPAMTGRRSSYRAPPGPDDAPRRATGA